MRDVMFVPGLNNTEAVFSPILERLGGSVKATLGTSPALDTVEAVADHWLARAPERFDLLGFSYGGYVSAAILEKAPQRVRSLVMLCTAPHGDDEATRDQRRRGIALARQGGYLKLIEATMATSFHPGSLSNEALLDRRRAMLPVYGADRYIAHQQACIARPDRTSVLAESGKPILFVAASHDAIFPPPLMREAAARVATARYVEIDRAGHLAPLERPEEIAAVLRGFGESVGV